MTPEQFKAYVLKEAKSIMEREMLEEKSKSKSQQRFMGAVRSVQKGETSKGDVSKKLKQTANDMSSKDVKDFAKTKHKGLPEKKPVNETVTPDSIAKLAAEMKAINQSLMVNNPLIAESNIVDSVIGKDGGRKLRTPVGREYNIELKDSLSETMIHYNDQKLINHKQEKLNETWNRLTNYKKFSDE
jgi:hypothetical protein